MEAISQEESGFDKVRRDQERLDWRIKERQRKEEEPEEEKKEEEQEGAQMEVEEESKVHMLFRVIGRIEEQRVR